MSPLQLSLVALLISWAGFGFCNAHNILYTNEVLYSGQSLTLGNYSFTMRRDCNLVLYDSGKALWTSGTANQGSNCYLRMQPDGNLVLYDGSNTARWASNTWGSGGNSICVLQHNRNVVVYGPARWSTGTGRVGTPEDVISAANFTETTAIAESESPTIAMVTE
uniref:non-specific serine/threonine protein kinase n=1 Tax=Ananas comosus var. bracteatus TaxID=296719 RepID=A0A6V7NY65_ANACO|nr:unnamed protein product [Ananas comosus var. bracteatus]